MDQTGNFHIYSVSIPSEGEASQSSQNEATESAILQLGKDSFQDPSSDNNPEYILESLYSALSDSLNWSRDIMKSIETIHQKKSTLFEADISNIGRMQFQQSIKSDFTLLNNSFSNSSIHFIEDFEDQYLTLKKFLRDYKERQAKMRAQIRELKQKLNEESINDSGENEQLQSIELTSQNLLSTCLKYKQKYHHYKDLSKKYYSKLEKLTKKKKEKQEGQK